MKKAAIIILILAMNSLAFATEDISTDVKGFDTNDEARFRSITVPVGVVQTARDLNENSEGKKSHAAKKKYFDKVVAIGLSPNEMKNLDVDSGDLLEVEAGGLKALASVYRVTGDASPPQATINLSVAAALKLQVKAGDKVEIHHPDNDSVPEMVNKPTVTDTSTRATEQSDL